MFRSYRDTVRTSIKVNTETLKKYYCDLCPVDSDRRVWPSECDVEIHRRKIHKEQLIELLKEPKNLMCTICLRAQADKPSLIAHIKTNHLLTPETSTILKHEIFICDYCTNIFFNKLLLITHIKYYHLRTIWEKKNLTAICPYCDRSIAVKSTWFHYLYHGILRPGTCPICVCPFDDKKDVLEHVESHKGCFTCCLCPYETKKGNLFTNHMEKHKKIVNLEGRNDVNDVMKYYLPQKRVPAWNRKVLNIFRGITLAPEIQICVLCRTMCETDEQMLQHIYGDHSPNCTYEIKRHLCACGEEFFNRVLLKHHIFTLKGEHKVFDGTETPTPKHQLKSDNQQETTKQNEESQITQADDDVDRTFGIVIEIMESVDSDYDPKTINFASHSDVQDESDYEIQSDDEMQSQGQNQNDAQLQNEIKNKIAMKSHKMDSESQNQISKANSEIDNNKQDIINIQTQIEIEIESQSNEIITSTKNQNEIEAEIKNENDTETEIIEIVDQVQNQNKTIAQNQNQNKRTLQFQNIINTDNNKIKRDARKLIITGKRKAESYKNNSKHLAVATKGSNIPTKDTIEIVCRKTDVQKSDNKCTNLNQNNVIILNEDSIIPTKNTVKNKNTNSDSEICDDLNKNFNQNKVILLNNLTQCKWRDSKTENSVKVHKKIGRNVLLNECQSSRKYYERVGKDVIQEDLCDSTVSLLQDVECVPESTQEATVYEVLEVTAESSDESGKIIIEDSFI